MYLEAPLAGSVLRSRSAYCTAAGGHGGGGWRWRRRWVTNAGSNPHCHEHMQLLDVKGCCLRWERPDGFTRVASLPGNFSPLPDVLRTCLVASSNLHFCHVFDFWLALCHTACTPHRS